jgi:hypothetical protein
MRTPTEEWAAKSIWGVADADERWGSPQREQEELNKLLMLRYPHVFHCEISGLQRIMLEVNARMAQSSR